jgi:hypothetical protein
MSDDTLRIIQLETEISAIKADVGGIKSDIKELKLHDSKSDEKQSEILRAVYSVGEKVIPIEARIASAERKLLEQKVEHKEYAMESREQAEAQITMLRAIQDEQLRRATEKAYSDKALSRVPLLLTLLTALGAVFNWYLVSKGSK